MIRISGACQVYVHKAAKFFRFVFPNREYRAYIRKAQRSNLFDPVFYRGNYPGAAADLPPLPAAALCDHRREGGAAAEPGFLADLLSAL